MLFVSGSLRQKSTNSAVLRTAARLVPVGATCELYAGVGDLRAFNPDDDGKLCTQK